MAFFGFFNVYALRVNLSVAIVAMTENRTVHYDNGTIGYVCICFIVDNNGIGNEHFAYQTGTIFSMESKRTRISSKLILLGLYNDSVCRRSACIKNWWKFGMIKSNQLVTTHVACCVLEE